MTELESGWTEPSGMVNFPGVSERVLDLESEDQLLILVQPLNYLWLWVALFAFHSPVWALCSTAHRSAGLARKEAGVFQGRGRHAQKRKGSRHAKGPIENGKMQQIHL